MIRTILVADDNALDNALLRNYLSFERYNILSAMNGQEALDFIEGRNVDLILLDTVMPVMDGYAFMELFSQTLYYRIIPVIIMFEPGNAENTLSKLRNYEIFDFISKPLDQLNKELLYNKIRMGIEFKTARKEHALLKAAQHKEA